MNVGPDEGAGLRPLRPPLSHRKASLWITATKVSVHVPTQVPDPALFPALAEQTDLHQSSVD